MNIVTFAVEAAGNSVSLHGPVLSDWPPSEVEILIALTSEQNQLSNAEHTSEHLHRKKLSAQTED
jgi:hypothetical protein